MNLRTRFIILIFGSILVPMLIMASIFQFVNNSLSLSDPLRAVQYNSSQLESIQSMEELNELSENMEKPYFMIVSEGKVIISSSDPQLENPEDIFRYENASQMAINTQRIELADGRTVSVIYGMDLTRVSNRLLPVLFLLSIAFVLISLSLLTIRSINKSISELEHATGKIAEGDLNVLINTSSKDKFGSLARSLDSMRHQIKEEYERRDRFFMGVSHDLKTPLASITGYADALIEGIADDKETTEKYLKVIQDKSHQLEDRITHLIHYLKLSHYDMQMSMTESSLTDFLTEFAQEQSDESGMYDRAFSWDIKLKDDQMLLFDEDLLRRTLENLVQNAYRYGNPSSPVHLSCQSHGNTIELCISNNGSPIPSDQLELIFEPFYRADKSRSGDGFGLGLALVKSIIEGHGWTISVRSDQLETTFIIRIPESNQ